MCVFVWCLKISHEYTTPVGIMGHCKCSVALLHGTVGWSAMCEFGISSSYSLTFSNCQIKVHSHITPTISKKMYVLLLIIRLVLKNHLS